MATTKVSIELVNPTYPPNYISPPGGEQEMVEGSFGSAQRPEEKGEPETSERRGMTEVGGERSKEEREVQRPKHHRRRRRGGASEEDGNSDCEKCSTRASDCRRRCCAKCNKIIVISTVLFLLMIVMTAVSWYEFDNTPGILTSTATVDNFVTFQSYEVDKGGVYSVWYHFPVAGTQSNYSDHFDYDSQSPDDDYSFRRDFYNGSTFSIYYLQSDPSLNDRSSTFHEKSNVWYGLGIVFTCLMSILFVGFSCLFCAYCNGMFNH